MRRVIARLSLAIFVMGAVGCHSPKMDAQATARAYYRALAAGRAGRAYDLLDPSLKKQMSRSRFLRNAEELSDEQRAAFKKAASSKDLNVSVVLTLHTKESRTLVWRKTKKGWRLTTNLFAFYPQDSPRQALRSFLTALQHRRLDILLRFVPRKFRKHMSDKDIQSMFQGEQGKRIRTLAKILASHLDDPMEIHGDSATLVYGDGAKVNLVREEGVWRILDIQ